MKLHRNKFLLLGIGLIALGVSLWAYLQDHSQIQYKMASLERGPIEATVAATGTCNAVTTVQVGSQVSGNIKELCADFNTKVKKGQLVARIDPEIFEARITQARAGLDVARAAVSNARAGLKKAEDEFAGARAGLADAKASVAKANAETQEADINLKRERELFLQGVDSAADRDTARATDEADLASLQAARAEERSARDSLREALDQREQARTQLATAQAQSQQAEAALQQAQIDLDHTYIRAPVNGTVISRNVDVGQTVAASFAAPTLFVIAQDLTKMKVDTNVDEADIGKVEVGQTATFTVDAFPRRTFRGRVVQIRKAPINVENVVTYDVVISVANPQLKLFPGMTANVSIIVNYRQNVLRIPSAALRFLPPLPSVDSEAMHALQRSGNAAATQVVWVLDKNETPRPVAVQLGISDGQYAQLIRGNLRAGEDVIVGVNGKLNSADTGPFIRGPQI